MSKIRVLKDTPVMDDSGNLLHVVELAGDSSETKPTTGIAKGSMYMETDTRKVYLYDEDDGWDNGGGAV